MKTFVVAISDLTTVSQLGQLSGRFTTKHGQVIIHTSPTIAVDGTGVTTNFDVILDTSFYAVPNIRSVRKHAKVTLLRECKGEQRAQLNYAMGDNPIWRKINCSYAPSVKLEIQAIVGSLRGDVVLKSGYGAMGYAQCVFNTNDYSASDIVYSILKLSTSSKDTIDDGEIETKEVPYSFDKFKEEYPKAILSFDSKCLFESKNQLKSNLFFEELIKDVVAEYRVLVSPNHLVIQPRKIKDGPYPQATGCGDGIKESIVLPKKIMVSLRKLIKDIGFIYGSIDLFKDSDGRYGIFEYSNQFGFDGVNIEKVDMIHRDLIEWSIGRFIKGSK